MLKKYQPGRQDLLINTDWGTAEDALAAPEAREKGLLLFHGRWVTKAEKKQIADERNAYVSIRIIGYLLLFICVPVLINIRIIAAGGIEVVAFAVVYAAIAAVAGSGLIRFARYARYPAVAIFLSFFVLPFLPFLESEKGAPMLFILGAAGLYYLLRKTARNILWPSSRAGSTHRKTRPVLRAILCGGALLIGFYVGYYVYEMRQAKHLAAAACLTAKPGMPLADYLSKFPGSDYRIIQRHDSSIIIPQKGLGRNHCVVMHDGTKITGAQTGFAD